MECLHGEPYQIRASYSNDKKAYRYSLSREFLEMIPGILFKETPEGEYGIRFEYDGKEYNANEINYTEKDIRDIFGATFEYDYHNFSVNIVIK